MNQLKVDNKNAKRVKVILGRNPRNLYEHQVEAMVELNKIDKKETFRSLLVLPTGGGKTLTAAYWLLKNAIDKKKKILWVAHRHLLLEQAADAFERNSYSDVLLNETSFVYRIISGMHDKPIHIRPDDNVLIVGKDSIVRNLELLGKWIANEEVYLIIDEAHHATAKSYRKIINYVEQVASNLKLLGLTATPFRTSENEQGLLGQIFTDDIVYKVDLLTLIKKGILSTPIHESCETYIEVGDAVGLKALKSIEDLDIIPDDIAESIANNGNRNRLIVKKYFESPDVYGPTLVFAINRTHAFVLKALFEEYGKKYGIKAGVIVSGTQAEFIGIEISNEENNRQIEAYRNGDIQILINVNILTEGTDLPKTQTVFLTRPTVSTVLMTQMVGRALRGEKAGGTAKAYIVSFVDDWNNKIAWVNPETLFAEGEFTDKESDYTKRNIRIISIKKIEEFAKLVDDTIDTRAIESIDFIKRVPIGMYVFTFIDENDLERNHQILVYDSTKEAYQELIASFGNIFKDYNIVDETIETELLDELCNVCEATYFYKDMTPPYNEKDVEYLLKFYAQKETEPLFVPIEKIDRKRVNLCNVAKDIVDKDMRRREQEDYINSLWNDKNGLIQIYFGNKYFFKKQLETEIDKLYNPEVYVTKSNSIALKRSVEELSIHDIELMVPEHARKLKDEVYMNACDSEGNYCCAECGKKSVTKALFQIDHKIPMAKGGLSIPENLQLLCRTCNLRKGDK
ncbi:DEAD/DEAH box helicase family protein [Anaeromicropila herbilytica]|uniref:Helicase n=1 Tax=Anaeromicropila herbilytica TaxID=2785025 RepID=A0A7R7EJH6_9FIRM|nr:DEAD/DEAH box helicase family protein [Anaeromicropila herbilytica]BCN30265.1 hypothetical protein bsdtb5_15600 [Anaeromicropila herbilytica]